MAKRKTLSRLKRVRIFDAHVGKCCLCEQPIRQQPWIVEHIKPLWLGGADDETNMAPAHKRCAIAKTAAEAPIKAKSDRVRANHLGVRRTSKGWPCGRDSKFKKKLNGEVIER